MSDAHAFDRVTALQRLDDGRWRGATSPQYWNFAGPFGGATAAVLLRAVLEHAQRSGDPVALTVNFCGLIQAGAYELEVVLVRGGRTTQHWAVSLSQADKVLATASIVCATRPETWAHQPADMPDVPPADAIMPIDTGGRLAWMSNYRFRFVEGDLEMSRQAHEPLRSPRSVLWLNDHPARPLDWLSLAALSDAFFPRVMHSRGTMAPMGTVTLTTYFHASAAELTAQADAPLLGVADGLRFTRSFQDQRIELWSHDGTLLATGMQVLWYAQ